MINYYSDTLENGLTVISSKDHTTPMVAVNLLYKVGARNEDPDKTGFAHLFEHLMFEGSKNIQNFDTPIQLAGGENNAFTTNDITNYYIVLPKNNIETAFWLESDRMMALDFSEEKLRIQKQVVIEEFKQRYLNQPYGDAWMHLRALAYQKHPYSWMTIGKKTEHIETATLSDVKDFFYTHYAPNNAILAVVGNIEHSEVMALAQKWFGPIPRRHLQPKKYASEPPQIQKREKTVRKDVPIDRIYKVYHMCSRQHNDYFATDLLSDVLSNGESSRLNQRLIKNGSLFSAIDAYILGSADPGLFIFSGKINPGESVWQAEKQLNEQIEKIKTEAISDDELAKVKNKIQSNILFSELSPLQKAMNLCQNAAIDKLERINSELELYQAVKKEDITNVARNVLREENSSTLFYLSKTLHLSPEQA